MTPKEQEHRDAAETDYAKGDLPDATCHATMAVAVARLEEIEKRRAAATPGPYETASTMAGDVWIKVAGYASSFIAEPVTGLKRLFRMRGGLTDDSWGVGDNRWAQKESDAKFLAASWADIGHLLELVRKQEREIVALKGLREGDIKALNVRIAALESGMIATRDRLRDLFNRLGVKIKGE